MSIADTEPVSYDQDYYAWLMENAALLQDGRLDAVDLVHLADELEDMGRSERRAMESYLKVLIVHLLRWAHQPERRGTSWELSVGNARDAIARRLAESPSLRLQLADMVAGHYPNARRHAALEMGLVPDTLSAVCPFTVERLLDESYWGD